MHHLIQKVHNQIKQVVQKVQIIVLQGQVNNLKLKVALHLAGEKLQKALAAERLLILKVEKLKKLRLKKPPQNPMAGAKRRIKSLNQKQKKIVKIQKKKK